MQPATSAGQPIAFLTCRAGVVAVQHWSHYVECLVRDELLIRVGVREKVETVMVETTVVNRIYNVLKHDSDLR